MEEVSSHDGVRRKKRSIDGAYEQMFVIETSPSVKTANASAPISLDTSPFTQGRHPYFRKVSKIREIVYCADGLFGGITYTPRHNQMYSAGWDGQIFGDDRSIVAIYALEQIERFRWTLFFGTSNAEQSPVVTAMHIVLPNPRLVIALMPWFTGDGISKMHPNPKAQKKVDQARLPKNPPPSRQRGAKKYLVAGKWAARPFHKFGYKETNGLKTQTRILSEL